MNAIPVPVGLFQALGAYLVERPYREVAALIDGLQQAAKPLPDPAPVAEPAA